MEKLGLLAGGGRHGNPAVVASGGNYSRLRVFSRIFYLRADSTPTFLAPTRREHKGMARRILRCILLNIKDIKFRRIFFQPAVRQNPKKSY
jgi:hypothetical protein